MKNGIEIEVYLLIYDVFTAISYRILPSWPVVSVATAMYVRISQGGAS